MIYQLYPCESRKVGAFSPLYQPLNLDPFENTGMQHCLPEIADEYPGMVYCWQHPEINPHSWIGFTSYNQKRKSSFIFHNQAAVEHDLAAADILTWRWLDVHGVKLQAERCHRGLTEKLAGALAAFGQATPPEYETARGGVYANYWIMSRRNFEQYMEWSYPIVKWMLNRGGADSFFASNNKHGNNVGYGQERLFIIWYLLHRKSVFDVIRQRFAVKCEKMRLLLTGAVTPATPVKRCQPNLRLLDYLKAIKLWLKTDHTFDEIASVDGSGFLMDFECIREWACTSGKTIHFLTRDFTGVSKLKGKGYGEAKQIAESIRHLSWTDAFFKCNGRLFISNAAQVCASNSNNAWVGERGTSVMPMQTRFLKMNGEIFLKEISPRFETLSDTNPDTYFESFMWRSFQQLDGVRWNVPPVVLGRNGTTGALYDAELPALDSTELVESLASMVLEMARRAPSPRIGSPTAS